jgi:hypothetical protein
LEYPPGISLAILTRSFSPLAASDGRLEIIDARGTQVRGFPHSPQDGFGRTRPSDQRTQTLHSDLLHALPLRISYTFETAREIVGNLDREFRHELRAFPILAKWQVEDLSFPFARVAALRQQDDVVNSRADLDGAAEFEKRPAFGRRASPGDMHSP